MDKRMLQNSPLYAYIPAQDVARARRFYEDKLGFRPREEVAGGVVYEFGKGTAGRRAEEARCEVRGLRHARHEDREWLFTGGGARAAWFRDSEGNILAVIQSL